MGHESSAKQPTMPLNVLKPGPRPQPPKPPEGSDKRPDDGPGKGSNKVTLIVALVVLVLAAAGGVTYALWPDKAPKPPVASPLHVVPGTVQAAVLTPDEASKVLGTTLIAGPQVAQPPAALSADPASCAVAVGPATASGYTKGWTVFLSTTYEDSTGAGDYTVTQTVGVYSDADQAAAVFGKLGDGVKNCPSATRTDANQSPVKWNYSVTTAGADTLAWSAAQDGGGGWACYRQARLKGKDVVQVAVCEGGDGKAAAQQVADQFTARVSG